VTPLALAGIVAAVVVVVAVIGAVLARRRPGPDDIASFRRQIDALSPEARRQTTDRMKPSNGPPSGDDGADGT
jgi:hypothetical protein